MLRGILSLFLANRLIRVLSGHSRGSLMHRHGLNHGWGSRHNYSGSGLAGLSSLFGLHRRRRSFI